MNLLDIYPTLASLTGCEPPEEQLEGNDLTALMCDPEALCGTKPPSSVFGYNNDGLRSERYLLYLRTLTGSEELYDHEKDRWEWQNLADNREYGRSEEGDVQELPTHLTELGTGVTYNLPGRSYQSKK